MLKTLKNFYPADFMGYFCTRKMKQNNLVMKHFTNFKTGIVSILLFLFSHLANAQHTYINNHKPMAEQLSKEYGIPSAIILAIAFVETGGGTSKNSKTLNNHFGIVGKNTVNKSKYKSFPSVQESYKAFCELVTRKKYYSKLKGNNDHTDWVAAIAGAGYSTQPKEWMRRVNLIISKYELNS